MIVAVLHGATGISRFTPDQLAGERWFLHVVEEIGELMAYAASGQATSDGASSLLQEFLSGTTYQTPPSPARTGRTFGITSASLKA